MKLKRPGEFYVTVFCASTPAAWRAEELFSLAAEFGGMLAGEGMVCANGGSCGMMKHVSRGAREAGGEVHCIGHEIWPFDHDYFTRSELHPSLPVRQMHLIDHGDAFVALPGGVGTEYEVYQVLCMKLAKEIPPDAPMICVGRSDFDELVARLGGMVTRGVVGGYADPKTLVTVVDTLQEVMTLLTAYRASR